MPSIRWPTRLADAGALACAAALFAAMALELPARAETRTPEAINGPAVTARPAPMQAQPSTAPRAADVARSGG